MSEQIKDGTEDRRLAHDYAWNWFAYHASQRLALFNLSLLALAALVAGCVTAISEGWYLAAALAAAVAMLLAVIFMRLDLRNSELTKLGERYLKSISEPRLAQTVGNEIRLCDAADKPLKKHMYTFGQNVRTVYWVAILAGLLTFAYAVAKWMQWC